MIGVPIKLLHEAENHVVTIELKNGELYRGYLTDVEVQFLFFALLKYPFAKLKQDTMNVRMDDVNVTARDGKLFTLEQVVFLLCFKTL